MRIASEFCAEVESAIPAAPGSWLFKNRNLRLANWAAFAEIAAQLDGKNKYLNAKRNLLRVHQYSGPIP